MRPDVLLPFQMCLGGESRSSQGPDARFMRDAFEVQAMPDKVVNCSCVMFELKAMPDEPPTPSKVGFL